jgi:hypothetical protein
LIIRKIASWFGLTAWYFLVIVFSKKDNSNILFTS